MKILLGRMVGLLCLPLTLALQYSFVEAQLNENCTVSVLNQTVTVNPEDGSFEIPNIPADQGFIRVRVTCVEDGVTLGGQSGFIVPVANGTIAVGDIPLGVFDPPPASIEIASNQTILNDTGDTAQLTVTGVFPDGSARNLTGQSTGTSYTTSNPAIASVEPDGLVTAGATSGTAIISARNEGVLATVGIAVALATDNDGDGLPNDFELANGLDPNDPTDAGQDPDGDGLTNIQEFNNGTLLFVDDTDGDGLNDGNEVTQGTNPTNPDSDLDGLVDGDESNPTGDDDGDGLVNVLDPDRDNDGLPDGVEVALVGNPTGANPFADSDGDGLNNLDEIALFTDPTIPDTDGDGLTDGEEVLAGSDPLLADSTPPLVSVTNPDDGAVLVEDVSITISADATDDGRVVQVDFLIDGSFAGSDSTAPFTFPFTVPVGVAGLTFSARAVDTNDNVGAAAPVSVSVIPDPGTTVVGRIVDPDGNPVGGATVTCLGLSVVTALDGTFSVSGLPSVQGNIRCTVIFVTADGRTLSRTLAGVVPVQGGNTDVGEIVLIEGAGTPTLEVASITPPQGTPSWVFDLPIVVRFSDPLDPATVTGETIFLTDATGARVDTSLTLSPDSTSVTLTPTSPLTPQTNFTLAVTLGIRSQGGLSLAQDFLNPFATARRIIYVDAASGNDLTGDGSAASPFATVARGIQASATGDALKVAAGFYQENITLTNGVTLQGAGADLTIMDGNAATTALPVIVAEPNTAILGVTVQNGDIGILGQDVPFIVGDSRVINNGGDGIRFTQPIGSLASGDIVISGSNITDNGQVEIGQGGVRIDGDLPGNVRLSGNTIARHLSSFSQAAVSICCSIDGSLSVVVNTINDNTSSNNGSYGIEICCDVMGVFNIQRNEIRGNGRGGMLLCCTFETNININDNNINDNTFSNNSGIGIQFCCDVMGVFNIQRNEIRGNVRAGVVLCCGTLAGIDVSDNAVSANGSGVEVCCDVIGGSTITRNEIRGNDDWGIALCCTLAGIDVSDNVVSANGRDGVEVCCDVIGGLTITRNEIRGNGGEGMLLCCTFEGEVSISDNVVAGSGREGIELCCTANAGFTIASNEITDNTLNGISLFDFSPLIQNNLIARNGTSLFDFAPNLSGVRISGNASPVMRGNTIQDNQGDGVLIQDRSQADLGTTADPGGNTITGNGVRDPSVFFDIRNESSSIISSQGNSFDRETIAEIDELNIFDDEEGQLEALATGGVNFNNFVDFAGNIVTVPDTTLGGIVVDLNGLPVLGATVSVLGGPAGLTDSSGEFSIAGAPTLLGPLRVTATAVASGRTLFGVSVAIPPVPGGITDLGQIVAAPEVTFTVSDVNILAVGGSTPFGIVSGDWDNDLALDLATGNAFTNNVSILSGNGLGGFSVSAGPTVGVRPVGIATGDFNGDTFTDLVTADESSNRVSVLLADQFGGFVLPRSFPAGQFPSAVATGDFDRDGDFDIAVANPQDLFLSIDSATGAILTPPGEIMVLEGDGFGGFSPGGTFTTGGLLPNDLAAGDFDGDGNLDLAVVHSAFFQDAGVFSTVSVLFGDGAGSFGVPLTMRTGPRVRSVIAVDLDVNGTQDIATVGAGDIVSVFLGDGTGNFTSAHFSAGTGGLQPLSLVSGDFNGDGVRDLAVGAGDATVAILLGDGAGGFLAARSFLGGESTLFVRAGGGRFLSDGDFNSDALSDLAIFDPGANVVRVLLNTTGP